jgi:hypothetical protein
MLKISNGVEKVLVRDSIALAEMRAIGRGIKEQQESVTSCQGGQNFFASVADRTLFEPHVAGGKGLARRVQY